MVLGTVAAPALAAAVPLMLLAGALARARAEQPRGPARHPSRAARSRGRCRCLDPARGSAAPGGCRATAARGRPGPAGRRCGPGLPRRGRRALPPRRDRAARATRARPGAGARRGGRRLRRPGARRGPGGRHLRRVDARGRADRPPAGPVALAVQRTVRRLVYGDREFPHRVVSELRRLDAGTAPEDALRDVLELLARRLHLSFAAVEVFATPSSEPVAAPSGHPPAPLPRWTSPSAVPPWAGSGSRSTWATTPSARATGGSSRTSGPRSVRSSRP